MSASCYRRMGDYHNAIKVYKNVLKSDPENVKCLEYICMIMKEINDPELTEYERKFMETQRSITETPQQRENVNQQVQQQTPKEDSQEDNRESQIRPITNENVAQNNHNNDDWGGDELSDDLLPT